MWGDCPLAGGRDGAGSHAPSHSSRVPRGIGMAQEHQVGEGGMIFLGKTICRSAHINSTVTRCYSCYEGLRRARNTALRVRMSREIHIYLHIYILYDVESIYIP